MNKLLYPNRGFIYKTKKNKYRLYLIVILLLLCILFNIFNKNILYVTNTDKKIDINNSNVYVSVDGWARIHISNSTYYDLINETAYIGNIDMAYVEVGEGSNVTFYTLIIGKHIIFGFID